VGAVSHQHFQHRDSCLPLRSGDFRTVRRGKWAGRGQSGLTGGGGCVAGCEQSRHHGCCLLGRGAGSGGCNVVCSGGAAWLYGGIIPVSGGLKGARGKDVLTSRLPFGALSVRHDTNNGEG